MGKPQPAPVPSSPGRQHAMRLQRTRDTTPELDLRRALHRRGLRYRLHQRLLPGSRCSADIVFRTARVVVDVRGCFWHGCPDHDRRGTHNAEWWERKLATNVQRDSETEGKLNAAGWLVIVVWEHDDAEEAAHRIAELIRTRREVRPAVALAGTPSLPVQSGRGSQSED